MLYVVSRVVTSFLPRAGPPVAPAPIAPSGLTGTSRGALAPPPGAPYAKPRPPNAKLFEIYAALTWGAVMYLFKERRDTLQGGMVGSMQVSCIHRGTCGLKTDDLANSTCTSTRKFGTASVT